MQTLPIFPLNLVLFPGGLLPLHIFEQRYVDMVSACLRNNTDFGIVSAMHDDHTQWPFARIGTSVEISDIDVPSPGLFDIKCIGLKKFKLATVKQQADGLWVGEVEFFNAEPTIKVPKDLMSAQESFERLIESFKQQGLTEQDLPFVRPYQFNDCAWLANRWSELLSLPLIQKQRLLDLESPLIRLELINDILNQDIKKMS
ncbi:MAG: LON peptidase substrate-binding domain-containing protein [Methylophilaceae bacterium]|jgi:uncharacterized protein|nr:MAG: LON peptidase substrate-binding domain-containing protein [Methylophilaceae bacterium]